MQVIEHPHIAYRDDGTPIIAGTNMKVMQLVLAHIAWGWDAQAIHLSHPSIGLPKIYCALAYYYDNREMLDTAISQDLEAVDAIFDELGVAPAQRRLAALRASRP